MLICYFFIAAMTFLAWLPFHKNPLYQDESLHYYIGKSWLKGKIPYRDYDLGPGPMFGLIYGIGSFLSKDSEKRFHLLSVGYVAIGNIFLFALTKAMFDERTAIVACFLFALYIFNPRLIGDKFPPEVYMATPCIISLFFLVHGLKNPTGLTFILCGVLIGIATLIRQGAFIYVPPLFFIILVKAGLFQSLWYLGGFAGSHLFWLAYFFKKGALPRYLASLFFGPIRVILFHNPNGPKKGKIDPMMVGGRRMVERIKQNSVSFFPLLVLSVSGIIYSFSIKDNVQTLPLVLVYFAGLILIFPRKNFDNNYWLNSVPWAAILAGYAISTFFTELKFPFGISESITIIAIISFFLILVMADYRFYLTFNPEVRDRLFDPKKMGHASWWPTFNEIGLYIKEHTHKKDKLLIIGHAARIHLKSEREAFYYFVSDVPHKTRLYGKTSDYEAFFKHLEEDYPYVIVLAGHMPAFPFNPKPYLKDMDDIRRKSGIVYIARKIIDNFPISFADTEKSYISAIIRGDFLNRRLQTERDKISRLTLKLESDLKENPSKQSLIDFMNGLKKEGRLEDLMFAINEIAVLKSSPFTYSEIESFLLMLGEEQFKAGLLEDAENTFLKILANNPNTFEAQNNLGVIYFEQKKYIQAIDSFKDVLVKDPGNIDAEENILSIRARLTNLI